MAESSSQFYLREARLPADTEVIVDCATRAFAKDPCFAYCGGVKEISPQGVTGKDRENLRIFMEFYVRLCVDLKTRFVVVCDREAGDKIVSVAYWIPPNERVATYQLGRLFRCGVWSVLKVWGVRGFDRLTTQFLDKCHHIYEESFKERGLKRSVEDTWYLSVAMTDPDYQGRGLLSLIVRHEWDTNPEGIYLIDATTPKSRDQYIHLGFDLQSSFMFGKGVVGKAGIPVPEGEQATGMEISSLIKWPASWGPKGDPPQATAAGAVKEPQFLKRLRRLSSNVLAARPRHPKSTSSLTSESTGTTSS